jgi:4-diphosphocytidyl-2-C-methyl-D-erythritol kinase
MLKLFSPAKINLFLRVIHRRDDGYHELETLMQAVDLGDSIFIQKASFDSLTCSDPTIPLGSSNLAWKAVELFRTLSNLTFPVSIHLHKHIPTEAGLGGGSSNAATVLWGLNALCDFPIPEKILQQASVCLGADVPFFFSHGAALCTGIGQIVENVPIRPGDYFLHKPLFGLSTKQVFGSIDYQKLMPKAQLYSNDLEAVALQISDELRAFKARLSPHYEHFFLTGSGSAFIGVGLPHPDGLRLRAIERMPTNWYLGLA